MPALSFFKKISHPGETLHHILSDEKISQRKLSFLISCDTSQLNRWIKGKENIPVTYMESICSSLCFDLNKTDYILNINECHNRVIDLYIFLDRIPDSLFPISTNIIGDIIIRTSEKLADQYNSSDFYNYPKNLKMFLGDGMRFLRIIKGFYKGNRLVSRQNIYAHLQHPTNIFFGEFIRKSKNNGLMEIRDHIITDMKDSYKHYSTLQNKNHESKLAFQHITHMLTRYSNNRNLSEKLFKSCDHFDKRMALYGMLLSENSEELQEEFIYLMNSSDGFSKSIITFDSIHYRDSSPYSLSIKGGLGRSVRAALMSIENDNKYRNINMKKLLNVLKNSGYLSFFGQEYSLKLTIDNIKNKGSINLIEKEFIKTFEKF